MNKPFRAFAVKDVNYEFQVYPQNTDPVFGGPYNCTVIPDGANKGKRVKIRRLLEVEDVLQEGDMEYWGDEKNHTEWESIDPRDEGMSVQEYRDMYVPVAVFYREHEVTL